MLTPWPYTENNGTDVLSHIKRLPVFASLKGKLVQELSKQDFVVNYISFVCVIYCTFVYIVLLILLEKFCLLFFPGSFVH